METQPARTALAWRRTGLSLLLVAGLLARTAAASGRWTSGVPALVVAVAALAVLGLLLPRRQRAAERAAATGGDAGGRGAAAIATGLVVLAAGCGLAADLLLRE